MQWQVRKKLLGTFIISVAFYLGSHLIYKVVDDKDRYCLEEDSGVGKWGQIFLQYGCSNFHFLWLLPILALVYFVLLAIANIFISAGWPGFPFGGAHLFGGQRMKQKTLVSPRFIYANAPHNSACRLTQMKPKGWSHFKPRDKLPVLQIKVELNQLLTHSQASIYQSTLRRLEQGCS